jgi:ferredoxin-type protein NapF
MQSSSATRRQFLAGRGQAILTGPYPPGITDESVRQCSGCGACADACPSRIISIRAGLPLVDFRVGECTFCGKCAERCPERVFPPDIATRFPHHAVIDASCLAMNFVDCQACRDVCPTAAIRFKPRIGGPFLPVLNEDACTGCGACVSVCPTGSVTMASNMTEAVHA